MSNHFEFAWNTNNYLNEYIKFADGKALALLGILTFVGGYVMTNQKDVLLFVSPDPLRLWLLWLGIGLFITALLFVFFVITPKTSPKSNQGFIFWENIHAYDDKRSFSQAFIPLSDAALLEMIVEQNHHLSRVNVHKYQMLKWLSWAVILNIVFWLFFMSTVNIDTLNRESHRTSAVQTSAVDEIPVAPASSSMVAPVKSKKQ